VAAIERLRSLGVRLPEQEDNAVLPRNVDERNSRERQSQACALCALALRLRHPIRK